MRTGSPYGAEGQAEVIAARQRKQTPPNRPQGLGIGCTQRNNRHRRCQRLEMLTYFLSSTRNNHQKTGSIMIQQTPLTQKRQVLQQVITRHDIGCVSFQLTGNGQPTLLIA